MPLTEQQKLIRDMKTLEESVSLDYQDLATLDLQKSEAAGIRKNIKLCVADYKALKKRLARLRAQ